MPADDERPDDIEPADPAVELADQAMIYLEVAGRENDTESAEAAIDRLEQALSIDRDHPLGPVWRFWLGLAHVARGEITESVADYDRGISVLEALGDDLPPGGEERLDVTLTLIDVVWSRFWLVRHRLDCDEGTARAETQRVVRDLDRLAFEVPAEGWSTEDAVEPRLYVGLAHLEWYDYTEDRGDLDLGITLAARGLDDLPDEAIFAFAAAAVTRALWSRAELTGDRADLDQAVAAGERAAAVTTADDPGRGALHYALAMAHSTRWYAAAEPDDLDRAIHCYRVMYEDRPAGWAAESLADMLRQRAERLADPAGLDEAIPLLEAALADPSGDPDEDVAFMCRVQLAMNHVQHWELTGEPSHLDAADGCLAQVCEAEAGDLEMWLHVHSIRMYVVRLVLDAQGDGRGPVDPAWSHRSQELVTEGHALFERATGVHPTARATFAGLLGMHETMYGGLVANPPFDKDRARRLLTLGLAESDLEPTPRLVLEYCLASIDMFDDGAWQRTDPDWGVARLTRLSTHGLGELPHQLIQGMLGFGMWLRGSNRGDLRSLRAAGRHMSRWSTPDPQLTEARYAAAMPHLRRLLILLECMEQGDQDGMALAAHEIEAAVSRGEAEDDPDFNRIVALVRMIQRVSRGERVDGYVALDPPGPPTGGVIRTDLLAAGATAVQAMLEAEGNGDLDRMREVAAYAESVLTAIPAGHLSRGTLAQVAGLAHLWLARRSGTAGDATRAVAAFEEATTITAGPHDGQWRNLAMNLAEARRLTGTAERAGTRRLAMSALRSDAWRVLTQTDPDDALSMAREAADRAARLAGWCREDHALDEMVSALDAGRGLVLQAATLSQGVAALLADAGHVDLADEWTSTRGRGRDERTRAALGSQIVDGEIPDNLRVRALRALRVDQDDTLLGPLRPVRVDEVRAALTRIGAAALVYLVPPGDSWSGAALVVPALGDVDLVELPLLATGPGTPVRRFTERRATARDLEPLPSELGGDELDKVCRYAWVAAVGALLDYAARWAAAGSHTPHVVLVPIGELSLVPWHAAYRDDGGARRFAVRDLAFSYAVSARALCTVAGAPERGVRSALVVGDPRGDLHYAGIEARAVHESFYAGGTYFGRHGVAETRPGTPGDVLDWIATATGPSLLHFACHGRTDPAHPADAHLALADGQVLPARRLLDASRLAELPLERVFLAACTTSLAGDLHDEAFSLAGAFLAAGARTVFGSLWAVPDVGTSVLMYMVHHYLNVEGAPPAEALHRAQLWMLDPDRKPPAGIPAALADLAGGPGLADPVAWAAFTHLGR